MNCIPAARQHFYDLLWGAAPGYVEVCAGLDGAELAARGWLRPGRQADPDKIDLLAYTRETFDADKASGMPHTRKYYEWPRQAAALERRVAQYAEQYGNVYVSLSTYPSQNDAKQRTNPNASCVLFLDDAPDAPELPYSAVVETSPYSKQAYYLLEQPLDARRLALLGEGAAERLRSDKSGADREQTVRVPGTFNTKRKADHHTVMLHAGYDTPYALEALTRIFLPGGLASAAQAAERTRTKLTPIDSAAWAEASALLTVENTRPGGPFLRADGTLRRLKPDHFINVKLRTGQWKPDGRDASRSGWRYNLLRTLWSYPSHPIAEIRALGRWLAADDEAKIGTAGLQADIDRILSEKLAVDYPRDESKVQPTRGLVLGGRPLEHISVPRAKRGRPIGDAEQRRTALLGLLTADALITRQALAAQLHTTPRTITTHLGSLVRAGLVEIKPEARGLRIVRVENNSPAEVVTDQIDVPPEVPRVENNSRVPEGGNYEPPIASRSVEIEAKASRKNTPPEILPVGLVPRPALGELVYRAMVTCEAQEHVNCRTGEIRPGRVTFKRVAVQVRETRPDVSERALGVEYELQKRRRQREHLDERRPAQLRTFTRRHLYGRLNWCNQLMADPHNARYPIAEREYGYGRPRSPAAKLRAQRSQRTSLTPTGPDSPAPKAIWMCWRRPGA